MIALLLFGKVPAPGRVKTRLAKAIGAVPAADLAEAFLRDAASRYAALPGVAPVVAADEPDDPFWRRTFPPPWRIAPQGDGSLGQRLARAFRRELARHPRAAAVGSDHPALPPEFSDFLAGDDGVWPTRDGGYAAILLSRGAPIDSLFDGIDWSTPRVLGQTLARAEAAGMRLALRPETDDVDEAPDLDVLARALADRDASGDGFPHHTWEALRRLERLP